MPPTMRSVYLHNTTIILTGCRGWCSSRFHLVISTSFSFFCVRLDCIPSISLTSSISLLRLPTTFHHTGLNTYLLLPCSRVVPAVCIAFVSQSPGGTPHHASSRKSNRFRLIRVLVGALFGRSSEHRWALSTYTLCTVTGLVQLLQGHPYSVKDSRSHNTEVLETPRYYMITEVTYTQWVT